MTKEWKKNYEENSEGFPNHTSISRVLGYFGCSEILFADFQEYWTYVAGTKRNPYVEINAKEIKSEPKAKRTRTPILALFAHFLRKILGNFPLRGGGLPPQRKKSAK